MGMSIDSAKLDLVIDHAAFIDLLVNPDKLKAILTEVKQTTDEYKKYLGPATTKQEVEAYLGLEKGKLEVREKELKKQQELYKGTALEDAKNLTNARQDVEKKQQALVEKQRVVDETFKVAVEKQKEAERTLAKANEMFLSNTRLQEDLNKLSSDLKDKQDKINKLLGS